MKTVFVNPERCIGCKQCQVACAVEHSQSKNLYQAISETPQSHPRIHVAPGIYLDTSFPNKCRHCDPAPCMTVCPTGAISRNADLNIVIVDGNKCITCAMCAMVCPFDVIRFYPSPTVKLEKSVAIKCDHCIERQQQGREPACVEACKVGALVFGDINELMKSATTSLARIVSVAAGEIQPEMTRIPGHVEAWRNLGESVSQTGKEA
ncbi:MAG: 4Fe-4S dicluster domain-containing protein [Chloroflexota bacterium]|nr:4Fe-4S dicluster domain-containing protein [Chloroflexota bacterium]